MTSTAHPKRKSRDSDETTITKLAKQAHADVDLVRHLYEEEIASLHKEASVKGFIGVIAARRVRQRLRSGGHPVHRAHHAPK